MKTRKTDYSEIAMKYDEARSGWVIPLDKDLAAIGKEKTPVFALDVGCGTGNYIRAQLAHQKGLVHWTGAELSLSALYESERYDLVAVADLKEETRNEICEMFPGIRAFASYEEMFRECPTDVVCVSTWPPSHLEVARAAIELPLKGILVEKPLADTWERGKEVLDLIKDRGLPMVVPHGLLVANHVREIVERVHAGEIGELRLIEIQCRNWDIINAGIHWLNFVVHLVPDATFTSVMCLCDASTRTFRDAMQVETSAVTYVQADNGLRVVMHTGDTIQVSEHGKGVLFRLIGSEGTIDFYGWLPEYRVLNADHPKGERYEVDPDGNRHQLHLENLANQIDSGIADYGVGESSLRALELVEAAYLSNRYGCEVRLALVDFQKPEQTDWDPGTPYSGEGGGRDGRKL
jgi:predicted dehydrogenase